LDGAGDCVLADLEFDPKKVPDDCTTYYYETKGYRLVPGDQCDPESGVDLRPIKHTCPNAPPELQVQPPSGPSGFGIFFMLVIPGLAILVAAMGVMYALSGRNPTIRGIVSKCLPESALPAFAPAQTVQYKQLQTNISEDLERLHHVDDEELEEDGSL
jgi:hypothetical protein